MPFVAVVGLSARMLAESATRAGLNIVALDLFGDRDTQRDAQHWFDIGDGALSVDPDRLVAALQRAARLPNLLGFVTASGLEGLATRLSNTPGLPRIIGNTADEAAAVRNPERFFAMLDTMGIAHPEIARAMPDDSAQWLIKDANGCGGTHIVAANVISGAAMSATTQSTYFQRVCAGQPFSALFVAARREACVIGFAEQHVTSVGTLRYVHSGSLGPVDLPAHIVDQVETSIHAIVACTPLSGLNSLDFLLDGDTVRVLEINARPSATMALYEAASPRTWPRGLLDCHIDACLNGRLPREPSSRLPPRWRAAQKVIYAPHAFVASARFSQTCFDDPACRDIPQSGTLIEAGQPVCTAVVIASTIAAARDALGAQHARILQRIATCHELSHDFIALSN